MYIEPSTNIKILRNVPLDNTYEHTIYFSTREAQIAYFNGLIAHNLTNYTYQRVQRGRARVGIPAEQLYTCNYLMYQNIGYGNKWFYAFITGVEYVNNETSEISFEIDVMQTWHFDYHLNQCFVEREHTQTDNIGDNIIDEGLNLGKYELTQFARSGFFNKWCVIVQCPYSPVDGSSDVAYTPSHVYNGVLNGNKVFVVKNGDGQTTTPLEEGVETLMEAYNNAGVTDSITAISMWPESFLPPSGPPTPEPISKFYTVNRPATIGSYTPRNNKLFTYPFNYLGIRNSNGEIHEYRYELFNTVGHNANFYIYADVNTFTFYLYPYRYNESGSEAGNYDEGMVMGDIPLCSYPYDAYKVWFAQNKVSLIGGTALTSIAGAAYGLATGNTVAAAGSPVGAVTGAIIQNENHKLKPNTTQSTAGSGIGIATNTQDFMNVNIHINEQHARMIDDYFTMYGYAVRRLKVPNRNVRPHWTYTKVTRTNASGSVPADDMKKICSIYENGITFWRNGSEVGNYNLNNSPA